MDPFIIGGAQKTATSSIVAMVNASEDAFSLYETDLNAQLPTKYAQHFLDKFPDSRSLFYSRKDYADAYREFHDYLTSKGYNYSVIGDKLPDHSSKFFRNYQEFKLIFCTRRPAEWLVKVESMYFASNDIRPVLFQFIRGLIFARQHSDALIITTEEFVSENYKVVEKVARHLSIELKEKMFNWWESAANNSEPIKSAQNWAAAHHSSQMAPNVNDTHVFKYSKDFWQPLNQMYNRLVHGNEIDFELEIVTLKKLLGEKEIALSDVIDDFDTMSFELSKGKLSRVIRKFKKVMYKKSNR